MSGIDRYEMYLPKSSLIGEKGYSKEKGYEQLSIGVENSTYNVGVTTEYIGHLKKDKLETNVALLGSIAENIDFQKINE
ncbi:hypothetical protein JI666_09110 [Bacillus sp. NTK071]|uniref:hypothetical protein n=1 Tax=Bacillus sp. NTK071 TaxID=2802175 RepID=UPI001A901435|nr:hypothetical protein [Bacillus sp. NTK071]MBN8208902.1 hypothetical protein [Bacillus sp. NTK071]